MDAAARLLVIDDDMELGRLLERSMAGKGYTIELADSGSQGIPMALSGRFAMVILDVMMPGTNGFEVLRRIRSESRVPILMLTAKGDTRDRVLGLELGADDYLPKPFDPAELTARVRAILRQVQPRTGNTMVLGDVSMDPGDRTVRRNGESIALTDVEFDILAALLMAAGAAVGGDNGEFVALRVVGNQGKSYAMVLVLRHTAVTCYWLIFPYFRLTAIVLISGVFCFLIARHVTRPLTRLKQAVAGLAEGRLDARAGTDFQGRGDEIAGLARDFNRMAARIEALINGHKQLMANVSHELRSPLSRLLVALSLVSQAPQAEVPEHLERIGAEARRLDKLIGQLLALSRLDSTVDGGERTAIDLATLVHEVSSDADFEGRAGGRRVEVAADPGCVIRGNEEALRSALENIVRNAVRHTADGTRAEVSLRREPTRTVTASATMGRVPDSMLRSIFVPFRRVENGTDGSGLGLAIAERAVVAHSGSLLASNAEGGGLVVEMELPVG